MICGGKVKREHQMIEEQDPSPCSVKRQCMTENRIAPDLVGGEVGQTSFSQMKAPFLRTSTNGMASEVEWSSLHKQTEDSEAVAMETDGHMDATGDHQMSRRMPPPKRCLRCEAGDSGHIRHILG